jgi:hypothetical protein
MRFAPFASLSLTLAACSPSPSTNADLGTTSPVWTPFLSTPSGTPRWAMPLVSLPSERRFVGFGGSVTATGQAVSETWSLSMRDRSWTKLLDSDPPPPRFDACVTALPDQNQLLLVGGRDGSGALAPAAWTLDVATRSWTAVAGEAPSGAVGCVAVWLPSTLRAIVFGGATANGATDETWSYEPESRAFTRLRPSPSPPARFDAVAVYDTIRLRMVLFAGAAGSEAAPQLLADLWAFDGRDWSPVAVDGDGAPLARRAPAASSDGARWLVFGGCGAGSDLADLWQLDLATVRWTQLPSENGPAARGFALAGYDAIAGEHLVVGGLDGPSAIAFSDGHTVRLP